MLNSIGLVALGVWAILTGFAAVTDIHIAWSVPLAGFGALVCGACALVRAFK
jgi:hypothetical protein